MIKYVIIMDEQLIVIDNKITELFDGSDSWKDNIPIPFYLDCVKYIKDVNYYIPSQFIDKFEFHKMRDDLNEEIKLKFEEFNNIDNKINRRYCRADYDYEKEVEERKKSILRDILFTQNKLNQLLTKRKPIDAKKWFEEYIKLMNERMNLLQTLADRV